MPIARHPPHKTVRARLRIRLPPWMLASKRLLPDAHRTVPVTLVSRSVSDSCWTDRCSPWSAPFPPPSPPRIAPLCSTGSQVLWRSPTPLKRACPLYGIKPFRTGLGSGWAEKIQRSPSSRACCFSACAGSQTTQGRLAARDNATSRVAFPSRGIGRRPWSNLFSKLNSPAHRCPCLRFN